MEKQSLFARCWAAFTTLDAFGCQHAASMAAIDKTYTRCEGDYYLNEKTTQLLRIRRCGHVYEVSRGFEAYGQFRVSEKWLGAYSWHSSGHLIALGKLLNIFFDLDRRLIVLENYTDEGPVNVEIYHEA